MGESMLEASPTCPAAWGAEILEAKGIYRQTPPIRDEQFAGQMGLRLVLTRVIWNLDDDFSEFAAISQLSDEQYIRAVELVLGFVFAKARGMYVSALTV